ncbi:MAG: restriction endonuclease subunit S [Pseudomonadota bacterium]
MSVPRYDSYRDSGVEWLGEVPSHWAVVPLKAATSCNDEVLGEASDPSIEIEYIEISDVSPELGVTGSSVYAFSEAPSRARRIVRDGDVIVSTVRTYLRAIAPIVRPPANLIASTGFAVIRPRRIAQGYLGYLFLAEYLIAEIISRSTGVSYPAINASEIMRLMVPLPSLPEQAAIAAFLDRETAKIDALVEEQRRLIALLAEKRQAVISHAVTKGLDPTVPMKDSGVEGLGEVPAHWEVTPLMRLTAPGRAIMYGIVLPGPDIGAGVPIVKGGDVRPQRLRLELLCYTTPEIEAPFARARLLPHDIVYSIRGSIGDAELVPLELEGANITQDVARISPYNAASSRWLLYVMKSKAVFSQLEHRSMGAAVRGINIFDLKRARIPVPRLAEQKLISAFLDAETRRIDALVVEASAAITLLQERRAALISAAVTGKIDVRGLVPAVEEAA